MMAGVIFDPNETLRDDQAAAARFPGPDYYEVLSWIHAALRPWVYLELGVLHGGSLRLARPPTLAIGVDPAPSAGCADIPWTTETRIHCMTARRYFSKVANVPPINFAFIDAYHRFEEVLADFLNIERFASRSAIVAIHDTIPLDSRTATRDRNTEFHTGDVWKILTYFELFRPDLDVTTVRTAPTGLTLVRCRPGSGIKPVDNLSISRLPFEAHAAHLRTIANSREAVEAWLLRQ